MVQDAPSLNSIISVPSKARKEITIAADLLPLSRVSLTLHFAPLILATDASQLAGAVVITTAEAQEMHALYDLYLSSQANGTPTSNDAYISELRRRVSRSKWRTVWQHRWRKQEHINVLESAAIVAAIQWAVGNRLGDTKLLILTDSTVCLGAFKKAALHRPRC